MRSMWGTLALGLALCLMVAVRADTAGDVSCYDVRVTLDPSEGTLVGSQKVDYVNDTDVTIHEAVFALLGNRAAEPNPYLHPAILDSQYVDGFDPTWTRIHGVTDAGGLPLRYGLEPLPPTQQTYSLADGILTIVLPAPLEPRDRVTLNIEFETHFAHAIAMDNCVYRDTFIWRFGWNPIAVPEATLSSGFVLPAADYRVVLTVPEAHRVFAGADHQTELETIAGLTTYELTNDTPVRSVPLAIGPDLDVVSSAWNGVELEAVYLPGGEAFARLSLSYIAEILAHHSERFGPLGYRRLVLVENPAPGFYGMAADGMILVGRSLVQLKDMPALGAYDRLIEYLLAHEAAHLWWGIGIGADFDAENWISEGFAEYLSITYFEEKHGGFEPNLVSHLGPGLLEDVIRDGYGYLNLRQHFSELPYLELLRMDFDEAIVKPMARLDYLNGLTIRTYSKGYLVLRALDALIGRDALRAALVEANAGWRGSVLSVDEFRRLAEEQSGTDLSTFFNDWLYGDARYDVSVDGFETVASDGSFTTTIELRRDGPELPVLLRVTLDDGSTAEMTWTADCCATNEMVFHTAAPVRSVHVDPNEMLPDSDRFNNHFPRRILVEHPLRGGDAPPIGMPLDAYAIRVSPTSISGTFRTDHSWAVMAIPHIDESATYDDLLDAFRTWDVVGYFAANVDRSLSVSASASVTSLDISSGAGEVDARLTLQTLGFTHPETGSAGTYWFPAHRFDLTLGALGELSGPIPYVSIGYGRSDALKLYMDSTVALRAGIPGLGPAPFATVEWTAVKRFRLAHLFYLDVSVAAGTSLLETLPTEFMFSMESLHAFSLPPYGHRQISGRAAISFPPLARNLAYPILNLTRVEDVAVGAYAQGGRTWGGCDLVCESGVRLEVGGLLTVVVDGFLGGRYALSLGYAYPLVGPDGEESVFFEFVAPF